MKTAALLALLLFSTQAFSLSVTCSKNDGTDSVIAVKVDTNGTFGIYPYEGSIEPSAQQTTVQTGKSNETGRMNSVIAIVNKATIVTASEGEESRDLVTAIFVYNPEQKAGRLTAVVNGHTIARNELFQNCK